MAFFFGSSSGTTLALACALSYPGRVAELILAAIATTTKDELDFLCGHAGMFLPEVYEAFQSSSSEGIRGLRMASAYGDRLTCGEWKPPLTSSYEPTRLSSSLRAFLKRVADIPRRSAVLKSPWRISRTSAGPARKRAPAGVRWAAPLNIKLAGISGIGNKHPHRRRIRQRVRRRLRRGHHFRRRLWPRRSPWLRRKARAPYRCR